MYFVLDESLPYGAFNDGEVFSDHYYAYNNDYKTRENYFWSDKEIADFFGGTVERYPDIIISRIKRSQIPFYSKKKVRMESVKPVIALASPMFNRDTSVCGSGSYHVELSYTGQVLGKHFGSATTTLFETRSNYILKEKDRALNGVKKKIKPNFSLNRENF